MYEGFPHGGECYLRLGYILVLVGGLSGCGIVLVPALFFLHLKLVPCYVLSFV